MKRLHLAVLILAVVLALPAKAETGAISLDETRRAALAELPPLEGRALEAGALTDRVVVIGFFASWCPPCRPEFATLNAIRAEFPEAEVTVLAVNIFEDHFKKDAEARLAGFLAKTAPAFAVLGEGERVAALFGPVTRIPTTFVFARDGGPAMHFIHEQGATKTHASLDELRAAVEAAL